MKLEVGMYVRTKAGITQYKEYGTSMGKLLCMPLMNGTFANIEDVSKASHNIIDLIEVGDYVNGYKVENLPLMHNEIMWSEPNKNGIKTAKWICGYPIKNNDEHYIKSIVTKEQFKLMEYRIGEIIC